MEWQAVLFWALVAGFCRSDVQCIGGKACVNNICEENSITNEDEKSTSRQTSKTTMKRSFTECTKNNDCADDKFCATIDLRFGGLKGTCEDPCETINCGDNAICNAKNHTYSCSCMPGANGDNTTGCVIDIKPDCTKNANCGNDSACVNHKCVNVCSSVQCGENAECIPRARMAQCVCTEGFIGDPNDICHVKPECDENTNCSNDRYCVNHKCVNVCSSVQCGVNAECIPRAHMAQCVCQEGFIGDPNDKCTAYVKPECKRNANCANDSACINHKCVNVCSSVQCGDNADCIPRAHMAECVCTEGFIGDPNDICYVKPECEENANCGNASFCINHKCVKVCSIVECVENAECIPRAHNPQCVCKEGYNGDAYVKCYINECNIDNDCHQNEACVNYKCQGACTDHPCEENAQCTVRNHVANCERLPTLTGNPAAKCQSDECLQCWPPRNATRKTFKIIYSMEDWYGSYFGCIRTGGRLASIRTKQEIAEVKELIANNVNIDGYLWVSGKRMRSKGVNARDHWYWMSVGLPIPMQGEDSDWDPTRPFWNDGRENCMVVGVFNREPHKNQWYDTFCTGWRILWYICEYYN